MLKHCKKNGSVIVEFALSALVFFSLVIGMVEFGRALFLMNMASRATQLATRLATVCSIDDGQYDQIRDRVRFYIESSGFKIESSEQKTNPTKYSSWQETNWLVIKPDGDTCYDNGKSLDPCWITSYLNGLTFTLLVPILDIQIPLPDYRVTQVRELMSTPNNKSVCEP